MKFGELLEGYSNTEMVKTSTIDKYKEFTREKPMGGEARFQKLKSNIEKYGIKEPLIIIYYKYDNTAYLAEGNHRLRIAKELGLPKVPVRVLRAEAEGKKSGNPVKPVRGYIKKDPIEHVPADLKPSQIGLK